MKIVKLPDFIVIPSYYFWRLVSLFIAWKDYRLRAYGMERVPKTGPVILAANHMSWLDPPLVGAHFPRRIAYMAKKELFEIRWLGPLITTMGAFPVDREGNSRPAIKHALEVLRAGGCVGIFPEGGRNVEGDKEAQIGVALLSAMSGAPVVPAVIINSERAKERPRPPVRVIYGEPLTFPAGRKASREELARFTGEIMAAIASLRERA